MRMRVRGFRFVIVLIAVHGEFHGFSGNEKVPCQEWGYQSAHGGWTFRGDERQSYANSDLQQIG